MSWHFLQEREGAFSVERYLAGLRCARLKSSDTRGSVCCSDSGTECCPSSPSGTMCVPLTEDRGEGSWMSYPEGSRARISAQRVRVRALTESGVVSGLKCTESFARFDHDSRSWRTPQCSLLEDLDVYSETWPKSGMMRRGVCWELPMSVRPTEGTESGFLQKMLYPTPIAHNAKEMGCLSDLRRKTLGLGTLAATGQLGPRGALNPVWVEWLMGWPLGWTDLNALETARFRLWLRVHSKSLKNY